MTASRLTPHEVKAVNTAIASENKIHDDAVARRFGFAGGLVPGVEVYAYMTHMPVEVFGRDWLERGYAECRFTKPVYDGHSVSVTATPSDDTCLDIEVRRDGFVCANGKTCLPPRGSPPSLVSIARNSPPTSRPPADERSLAPGTTFGVLPFPLTAAYAAEYLHDIQETHRLYEREQLCHPGIILRLCNWTLAQNVVLGPWIHTGSQVQNFSAARIGDELSVVAHVVQNYERKGHRLVDLDVIAVSNGKRPIARILHTAIYRPRQIEETR